MGRNSRAKPKKAKTITLTEHEVEKIKKRATAEAVKITGALALAVMVQNHGLTEDEVFKDMEDMGRWAQFMDAHYLQIQEVLDIVEARGGIKILDFDEILNDW